MSTMLQPLQITQNAKTYTLIVFLSRFFRLKSKVLSRVEVVNAPRLQTSLQQRRPSTKSSIRRF